MRLDPEDRQALARLALIVTLATGGIAWAAAMVVLVKLIVGV